MIYVLQSEINPSNECILCLTIPTFFLLPLTQHLICYQLNFALVKKQMFNETVINSTKMFLCYFKKPTGFNVQKNEN